jgi:hypothetical protein
MANEITISTSISASKGGASISSGTLSKSYDLSGDHLVCATQEISATADAAELLDLGDIASPPAVLLVKNLDTSNYVDLAMWEDAGGCTDAEFVPHVICRIPAGQSRLITPVTQDDTADRAYLYAKANTAPVTIQYWATEA